MRMKSKHCTSAFSQDGSMPYVPLQARRQLLISNLRAVVF